MLSNDDVDTAKDKIHEIHLRQKITSLEEIVAL